VFERLTSRELAEIVDRNYRLTHQALPAMASPYEQIRNTRCMVVLNDAQGMILHSLGDDDFMEKARRVALQPGVSGDEASKSTNAIGTALFENARSRFRAISITSATTAFSPAPPHPPVPRAATPSARLICRATTVATRAIRWLWSR
jgi:hypothetical protein